MKLNIEIDCTPEELQELFIPGEKQTELLSKVISSLGEQVTTKVYDNYPDFISGMMDIVQKNQEQIFKAYTQATTKE